MSKQKDQAKGKSKKVAADKTADKVKVKEQPVAAAPDKPVGKSKDEAMDKGKSKPKK